MAYKRYPTWKQLSQQLGAKKLDRIYCFIGEEEGEKDRSVASIGRLLFGTAEREQWDLQRYHAEDDFSKAVEAIVSQSMFSSKSLVIVYNINRLQVTRENKQLINEMVDGLPASTLVVLTSDENRLPSIIHKDIAEKVSTYHFWRYFESDIKGYIKRGAQERAFTIDAEAEEKLLEMVGNDTRNIDGVLDQLMYASIDSTVGVKDIMDFATTQMENPEFQFVDHFFVDDSRAYGLLDAAIESGVNELMLLALLFNHAERMEQYHEMKHRGLAHDEIFKALRLLPKKQDLFMKQVRHFPRQRLAALYPALHRADYMLKSTRWSREFMSNPMMILISETMRYGQAAEVS
ncbi:MAG: DNA polymerase III subunit delta [Spirochaetota bacterium]